jgi:hypothetical protein
MPTTAFMPLLEEFDAWYPDVTGTDSHLADEWPLFVRSDLDMVARQAHADLKMMDQGRTSLVSLMFMLYWTQIMAIIGGDNWRRYPESQVGSDGQVLEPSSFDA